MIVLGLIIGCILMYFVLKPKLTQTQEIEREIEEQNTLLRNDKKQLEDKLINLKKSVENYQSLVENIKLDISVLTTREKELENHIQKTRETIDKDNNIIFQKSFELMQEKLSQAADAEAQFYREAQDQAKMEYLQVLKETAQETAAALALKRQELDIMETKLENMRAKTDAAIAAAKREEEKLLEIDKYKILVTDLDLLEINRLREIAPYFRNARAIYKIIWESYYRNLTTEMINRVVGAGDHTGIYKLTNLTNQKVYIGQAVDIGERFKQHTKCGLGIDTPSNMLYTAMIKDGVENFTFEVLEECERGQLNDREKYYIDFYRAQEHGYNMSRGGARN